MDTWADLTDRAEGRSPQMGVNSTDKTTSAPAVGNGQRFDEGVDHLTPSDARGRILAMTRVEIDHLKAVYLSELAACQADRHEAASKIGLTLREIAVFEEDDVEFKAKAAAVLEADDRYLADEARNALRELIRDGSERTKASIAMYLDKVRGGYGQSSRVDHKIEIDPSAVHPVDTGNYAGLVTPIKPVARTKPEPGVVAHEIEAFK